MSVTAEPIHFKTKTGNVSRRLPIGAEVTAAGVHFRVWAPNCRAVQVVFEDKSLQPVSLQQEDGGYFSGLASEARAGSLYKFRLDDDEYLYPDPASRFQPEGPHGYSQVVDHSTYKWTDTHWPGIGADNQVIYEMHIGTFTKEGTFESASRELQELKNLGITCIEVMPVAEFAGRWGWGYDGVDLFAPTRLYGSQDDFRRFVDRAHAIGLAVILDVVYNHFGPDGNYIKAFSDTYFSKKHANDWGESINFDDAGSEGVRDFFTANARYWIEEFHLDGYRYDATDAIVDDSKEHILAAVCKTARATAGKKSIFLVNENEQQQTRIVRAADKGGYGMDALWNDDFHHSAQVVLLGRNEAYFNDHLGRPQEFVSAAKWGYLFQGQYYTWQKKRRGTPSFDLPATAFVNFIENHDQVANYALGLRAHQMTSPSLYRTMAAMLLLLPQTPMLFQGQEFACSSPFQYFVDHNAELAKLVSKGRYDFMSQFPSVGTPQMRECLPDPSDPRTFERCKLDLSERTKSGHAGIYQLYKDLLKLRREEPALRGRWPGGLDGAVLGDHVFALRYFAPDALPGQGDDRLLVFNFDADLHLTIAPEPLLAPPIGRRWELMWSSEQPQYGGLGALPLESPDESWRIPGRSASLLRPVNHQPGEKDPLRAPANPNV